MKTKLEGNTRANGSTEIQSEDEKVKSKIKTKKGIK
jgi:hypothetical protein